MSDSRRSWRTPTWLVSAIAQVGGQAVIEGVMMRSAHHWSVALRTPDQEITVHSEPITPWVTRRRWFGRPIIRGVIALGESLVIGMKALAISAETASGDDEADDPALSRTAIGLTLAVSLALAVGLFFLLPIFLTKTVLGINGGGFVFWAVEGVVRLAILLAYLWAMSLMPDLRRVFQYHAAEHMAIHALEADEPITAESAGRHSQLHVRCGTAFLLIVMVISIFVFAAITTDTWIWLIISRLVGIPVIAGLSYEVIRFAGLHRERRLVQRVMAPGLWLQHLTTRTPQVEHLEVACVALTSVLELERGSAPDPKIEVLA